MNFSFGRFGLLAVTLLVGGCALTTEKIDLAYAPVPSSPVAGAANVPVDVQIVDQRQDKSTKVSAKKNGFGMEMAPILAGEDVAVTLRRAFMQELAARGFPVRPGAGSVLVSCDLTRFWNDHKPGLFAGDAVADLHMTVAVRGKDGRPAFSRTVIAQGIEPNTQLMTGNNARLALNRALVNGMKILFDDPAFVGALLGTPSGPMANQL